MLTNDYDARALALPLEDEETGETPVWSRRSTSSFRHNNPSFKEPSFQQRLLDTYHKWNKQVTGLYSKLSPIQKVLFVLGNMAIFVAGVLFLVYSEQLMMALLPYAKKWRDITAGWLILWSLIFLVSFPPLIGYSTLLTVAGFVYGFPNGWFIAATATLAGSTASFILSRTVLKNMVARLLANDTRFAALALTLKHDGLKLLVMIRMCPLPYSLSNGAIATFPTVHWASHALATAIVSPKLMLHIFIGAQFEKIAEGGGKMDAKTKAVSYTSIAISMVAGLATGMFMYRKTKLRAAQLEAEERVGIRRTSFENLENDYAGVPARLEAAHRSRSAQLREEDDDISLRSDWDDEYTDEPEMDMDDAVDIGDDAFGGEDSDEP